MALPVFFAALPAGGNVAIIVLIGLLLMVPLMLFLLDHLRSAQAAAAGAAPAERGPLAAVTVDAQSGPEPVREPASGLRIVAADAVTTTFGDQPVPDVVAYVPPYTTVTHPIRHRGFLQVGSGAILLGDVNVAGCLALDAGAEVRGSVRVRGDLHLGMSSHVMGEVAVEGDAHLGPWAEVGSLWAGGRLLVREGATVRGAAAASCVHYVAPGGALDDPVRGFGLDAVAGDGGGRRAGVPNARAR